jgi:hypothetical protein
MKVLQWIVAVALVVAGIVLLCAPAHGQAKTEIGLCLRG